MYNSCMPRWRNGIRSSLKNLWGQPHEGSIPSLGTKNLAITGEGRATCVWGKGQPECCR